MENGLNRRGRVSDFLYMVPVFVFILSILLVRLHMFSMPMTDVYWSSETDTSTMSDLFSFWKAMAIICSACLAVIVFVIGYFKDSIRLKRSFLYIPALVYVAFTLFSLAFSDYKYFALRGMGEHFEGTAVLLAYVLMVAFLANAVDSERRLRFVVYCALVAAFLLGILGITQATGNDFLSSTVGQKLMTPNYMLENGMMSWDMIDIMSATGQKVYDFSFTDGEVYQTVYNINYVPLYLCLLVPVSAVLFISFETCDSKVGKSVSYIFLGLYGLLLYSFFSANSASGYLGLVAIFVTALIVFRKKLKLWVKPIVCLVVVLGLVMGLTAGRWMQEVKNVVGELPKLMATSIYAEDLSNIQYDNPAGSALLPMDYVETGDRFVKFGINNNTLVITRDDEHASYMITDEDGNQLFMRAIDGESGSFEILDDRFHDALKLSLQKDAEGTFYVVVSIKFHDWKFKYGENGFEYVNAVGKAVKLTQVPHSSGFAESFASERGRIWNTTIPSLKSYILKGAGADCFVFVFPQNDYATLYSLVPYGSQMALVTDKAHNLYMQYWVNTGLISLLAWLALVGYYLVGAVKQFRKRGFAEFSDFVNGGIFCGIIGFLFVAFFNDGSVNTMPMFYTMLGTGLAINMKDKWVKADEETKQKEAAMPEI